MKSLHPEQLLQPPAIIAYNSKSGGEGDGSVLEKLHARRLTDRRVALLVGWTKDSSMDVFCVESETAAAVYAIGTVVA